MGPIGESLKSTNAQCGINYLEIIILVATCNHCIFLIGTLFWI